MQGSIDLEKENIALRRKLHSQELAFNKDNSLLMQKLEHYEEIFKQMEKREIKLRSNQKLMTSFIEQLNMKEYYDRKQFSGMEKKRAMSQVRMMKEALNKDTSHISDNNDDRKTNISRQYTRSNYGRSLSKFLNENIAYNLESENKSHFNVDDALHTKREENISTNQTIHSDRQKGIFKKYELVKDNYDKNLVGEKFFSNIKISQQLKKKSEYKKLRNKKNDLDNLVLVENAFQNSKDRPTTERNFSMFNQHRPTNATNYTENIFANSQNIKQSGTNFIQKRNNHRTLASVKHVAENRNISPTTYEQRNYTRNTYDCMPTSLNNRSPTASSRLSMFPNYFARDTMKSWTKNNVNLEEHEIYQEYNDQDSVCPKNKRINNFSQTDYNNKWYTGKISVKNSNNMDKSKKSTARVNAQCSPNRVHEKKISILEKLRPSIEEQNDPLKKQQVQFNTDRADFRYDLQKFNRFDKIQSARVGMRSTDRDSNFLPESYSNNNFNQDFQSEHNIKNERSNYENYFSNQNENSESVIMTKSIYNECYYPDKHSNAYIEEENFSTLQEDSNLISHKSVESYNQCDTNIQDLYSKTFNPIPTPFFDKQKNCQKFEDKKELENDLSSKHIQNNYSYTKYEESPSLLYRENSIHMLTNDDSRELISGKKRNLRSSEKFGRKISESIEKFKSKRDMINQQSKSEFVQPNVSFENFDTVETSDYRKNKDSYNNDFKDQTLCSDVILIDSQKYETTKTNIRKNIFDSETNKDNLQNSANTDSKKFALKSQNFITFQPPIQETVQQYVTPKNGQNLSDCSTNLITQARSGFQKNTSSVITSNKNNNKKSNSSTGFKVSNFLDRNDSNYASHIHDWNENKISKVVNKIDIKNESKLKKFAKDKLRLQSPPPIGQIYRNSQVNQTSYSSPKSSIQIISSNGIKTLDILLKNSKSTSKLFNSQMGYGSLGDLTSPCGNKKINNFVVEKGQNLEKNTKKPIKNSIKKSAADLLNIRTNLRNTLELIDSRLSNIYN